MTQPRQAAFLVASLLFAAPSAASADEADDFLAVQLKQRRIPGCSVAVVRDGKLVKAKGYGLANVEHQVPAKPETVYQSGSVGKQFTSMAVMMLVEDGKLGLDDPITKYFDNAPEHWKPITVRHLLTHTAGVKNYTGGDLDLRRNYTDEELFQKAAAYSLDFEPGANWRYSNTGYLLLGLLIEKAAGKFYGDLLQERVFKPLGMDTARIINEADIIPNRAAGYRLVRGTLKNQEWVSPSLNRTADGALYLTVLDMAKWDAALYTEKLVKKASLEQMWTPVKLKNGKTRPYGFGWALGELKGHKLIEHGGGWQGFTAHISRFVDDKLTVILLANLAGVDLGKIAHDVAGFYVPDLAADKGANKDKK